MDMGRDFYNIEYGGNNTFQDAHVKDTTSMQGIIFLST